MLDADTPSLLIKSEMYVLNVSPQYLTKVLITHETDL
jgi:hypothetical protein